MKKKYIRKIVNSNIFFFLLNKKIIPLFISCIFLFSTGDRKIDMPYAINPCSHPIVRLLIVKKEKKRNAQSTIPLFERKRGMDNNSFGGNRVWSSVPVNLGVEKYETRPTIWN